MPGHRPSSLGLLAIVLTFAACSAPPPSGAAFTRRGVTRAITLPDARIEQADIDRGLFTPDELFDIGDFLFNHTFTPSEGLGNALSGPPAGPNARPNARAIHNGKFGGPDSVQCNTCHTVGGDDGGGTLATNLFEDGDGVHVASSLVRNAKALVGVGYLQQLGLEMTADLASTRDGAIASARQGSHAVSVPLSTKGVSFGTLVAHPDGSLDTSGVEGLDGDLVVKPLAWKGRVATLRRFVEGGFQVHLGMASDVLIAQNCAHPIPAVVGNGPDCTDPDNDGVTHEITEGQLTAMATYMALQQVPIRIPPSDPDTADSAEFGEQLFDFLACTTCHVPILNLNNPVHHEVPDLTGGRPFQFDLTRDGHVPRLSGSAGGVQVPLFSDLKRHDMGDALADPHDTFGVFPARPFLTPALWGVADSPPYLHDGRAATLLDAILAHHGEAENSRAAFVEIGPDGQRNVLDFLGTLKRDPNHAHDD
jgi:cytochrome c peroxidase